MVSVLIPAYNAEEFLKETVYSVISQSYEDFEIIIINDGSKDNTLSVCDSLAKEDRRVRYFNQENQGVSSARNHAIKKSKGDYIAFLDADDAWLKDNLMVKINFLKSCLGIDWVYSDMYHADEKLNIIEEAPKGKGGDILEHILLWNGEVVPGPCSNLVVKRKCFDQGCLFDSSFSTAADQDFCIQLASKYKGAYIDQVLWKYRYIASSMSRNVSVMEKDHIGVFNKAKSNGLFKSRPFQRQCFSNLYLIIAGSWWVNGENKLRALWFIIRGIAICPSNISKLIAKL